MRFAHRTDMALRSYIDRDGNEWNAWFVRPSGSESNVLERFRSGWVCFQRADGSQRCRLAMDEVPSGWEELSDERLDLLRRVATVTGPTASTPQQMADRVRDAHEASAGDRVARARKALADGDDAPRA